MKAGIASVLPGTLLGLVRGYGTGAAGALGLVLLVLVIGCGTPLEDPAHTGLSAWEADRPDPRLASAGAGVFRDFCSSCHGVSGRGGAWAPTLHTIGLDAGDVSVLVRTGVDPPSMPAFASILTDSEINAVAAYTVELRYSG